MIKNLENEPWNNSHMCVEQGDEYHPQTAKDLSGFQNLEFLNNYLNDFLQK